ncbi:MAG TPA: response regulator [Chitinophagales bacterium]|nr:response regulator [Chitinophagales bacterium]
METHRDKSPFRILIADDDHDDIVIVREVLSALGDLIQLDHVVDGQSLIDLLLMRKNQREIPIPDLIFLDLNMPRKSGLETLRELKGDKELCEIPVTVLSTASDRRQIGEVYALGANCYITKPAHYNDWLIIMRGLLQFFSRKNIPLTA